MDPITAFSTKVSKAQTVANRHFARHTDHALVIVGQGIRTTHLPVVWTVAIPLQAQHIQLLLQLLELFALALPGNRLVLAALVVLDPGQGERFKLVALGALMMEAMDIVVVALVAVLLQLLLVPVLGPGPEVAVHGLGGYGRGRGFGLEGEAVASGFAMEGGVLGPNGGGGLGGETMWVVVEISVGIRRCRWVVRGVAIRGKVLEKDFAVVKRARVVVVDEVALG